MRTFVNCLTNKISPFWNVLLSNIHGYKSIKKNWPTSITNIFSAYFATKMSVNVINVGNNMYVRTHLKPIIIVFHQSFVYFSKQPARHVTKLCSIQYTMNSYTNNSMSFITRFLRTSAGVMIVKSRFFLLLYIYRGIMCRSITSMQLFNFISISN